MKTSRKNRTGRAALAAAALFTLTGVSPAAGGATVRVSAAAGLTEGQEITVDGTGFSAGLTSVAVGLCKMGYTGNKDCDLGGGARLVTIGPDGVLPRVTLTVHGRFAGIDCRTAPCVIGVAPLPSGTPPALIAANSVEVAVGFEGGTVPGEASGTGRAGPVGAAAPGAVHGDDWSGPSTPMWALSLGVACAGLLIGAHSLVRSRPQAEHPEPPLSPSDSGGNP
ncbi:neocarzinostatin apoprotein domain-containing protein [Streptomyces sp. NPDC048331]|uniref:neocarzinostatin apoprotein domain-containing protein n=1 Tax=Streptomyces sp. NPDC048331 TaxID=3365534 RepID=UPI00371A2701